MSAQLVLVSLGGAKQVRECTTVARAVTEAQRLLTRETRGIREIKVISDKRCVRRWRSYARWIESPQ